MLSAVSRPREMTHVPRLWAATAEELRLQDPRGGVSWRAWGPCLSERQWGTVRGNYSEDGEAWSYFAHDQARPRGYRCGDDGLAGISDESETLCLALALWNERDPILSERLFGLTRGRHLIVVRDAQCSGSSGDNLLRGKQGSRQRSV